MKRWTAVAHFGSPFWGGHDFVLTRGPRWWCALRAHWWLASHEWSSVRITPLTVQLGEDGKVRFAKTTTASAAGDEAKRSETKSVSGEGGR